MKALKLNVNDILRPRINGKHLKKVEWWSQDKERQRPWKEGCTNQRPALQSPARPLISSLFYLRATLTLIAPHCSPFTLFFLKPVHPPSLPWFLFSHGLSLRSSPFYSNFLIHHFKTLALSVKGQFLLLLQSLWNLWALDWNKQCSKGKRLNFVSSIPRDSEPHSLSAHRLSSDSPLYSELSSSELGRVCSLQTWREW